jgi:hypothetical protein
MAVPGRQRAAVETYVFDVYPDHDGWHVHRAYE